MSRYQMYWQVYFHPVSRSAEVILRKILHRAKALYHSGYNFLLAPKHFQSLFEDSMTLDDYLRLDEAVVQYYFQVWQDEDDMILSDLCSRFLHRNLFKYIEFVPIAFEQQYEQLEHLFQKVGLDPYYYLVCDSTSDLPYDFYRPGISDRISIQLLMPNNELAELSTQSDLVKGILGKRRTDHKLYFPLDILEQKAKTCPISKKIVEILAV